MQLTLWEAIQEISLHLFLIIGGIACFWLSFSVENKSESALNGYINDQYGSKDYHDHLSQDHDDNPNS